MKARRFFSILVAGALAALLLPAGTSAQGLTALAIEAAGKAAYMKGGAKPYLPIQVNVTRLSEGDVILTGPDSRVRLLIEGKAVPAQGEDPAQTTVDVQARSKVQLRELLAGAGGGENVRISIAQGQVISNVRKIDTNSERFEVETPTAVAAVRGTNYATLVKWIRNKPKSQVKVNRGSVALLDPITRMNRRVMEEGEILEIGADGGISAPAAGAAPAAPGGGGPAGVGGKGGIGGDGRDGGGEDSDTGQFDSDRIDQDEGDDTGGGHEGPGEKG